MCARFFLDTALEVLEEMFGLVGLARLGPRYNIAPTQNISVVRNTKNIPDDKSEIIPTNQGRSLDSLRWGLIPHWTKDLAKARTGLINARCETVAEKPSFRKSFQTRRCLIPATGFYEWKSTPDTSGKSSGKQPYCIRRTDDQPFAFAGLWDVWYGSENLVIESCTLLTTKANSLVMPIHDRMPVIIDVEDFDFWLDNQAATSDSAFQQLFKPYSAKKIQAYPVSKQVNQVSNDTAKCIEPVTVSNNNDTNDTGLFG